MGLGDFNGDGRLDLATANIAFPDAYPYPAVQLWLGTGTGGLVGPSAASLFTPYSEASGLAVGDLNGDSKLDLAVADITPESGSEYCIWIQPGTGTGNFQGNFSFRSTGKSPFMVALGDFNGDGRLDLATANRSGNNASILLNTGMGSELAFGPSTEFAASDSPHSLALGDFNEDGKLDLAVANYLGASVSILLGQ